MNTISHITVRMLKSSAAAAVALAAAALTPGWARADLTAKANHDHIKIDIGYHGSTVSVSGVSDPGTDLVIRISSPEGEETLRQKEKASGIIWMNGPSVHFTGVPRVYYVYSSGTLADMLTAGELERLGLGYEALEETAVMSPKVSREERHGIFQEFLRYKEASRLYGQGDGRVSRTVRDGVQKYYMKMDWPYQAPPGDYEVTVLAVRDGGVVESASSSVRVEQTGMVKFLAGMARDKGALYGGLSILAALACGFGVGMVFKKGNGAH